jgi:hypothetical protein
MPLANLTEEDRAIAHRCVRAAADGPFFEEWEFHTLFGVTRSDVRGVLEAWPTIDETDENVQLAIHNSFVNLLGYPHGKRELLARLIGADVETIARVFEDWRRAG